MTIFFLSHRLKHSLIILGLVLTAVPVAAQAQYDTSKISIDDQCAQTTKATPLASDLPTPAQRQALARLRC